MKIDRPPIIATRSVSVDNSESSSESAGLPVNLRVVKHPSDKTPKKPYRSSWNMDGDVPVQSLSSLPEDEISTDYTFGVSGITNPSALCSLNYISGDSLTWDSSKHHGDSVDMLSTTLLGRLDEEEKEDDDSLSLQDRAAFNVNQNDMPPQVARRMHSSEWSMDFEDHVDRFEEREPSDQDKPVSLPKRSTSGRKPLSKLAQKFRARFAGPHKLPFKKTSV